ncbi:MAG: M6 family metalloprotease domain-containing protein [Bacteroidales bacterium]|nr:M6 family metalloprotease domain-containing protein [Bacteroidales bacterium]
MKRYIVLTLLFLFAASLRASAIPARNTPVTVRQPDGSELRIIVSGDEFYRMARTEDGCAVIEGTDGYWYYAAFDFNGARRSSGVRVSPGNGATAAAAASRMVPRGTLLAAAARRRDAVNRLRASHRFHVQPDTKAGTQTRKAIIILAQFPDLAFKFGRDNFVNMLTQKGYSYGGAKGSAMDYFNDQFEGACNFEFVVSPVITLSKGYAYYGENNSQDLDKRPHEAVAEACRLVDAQIDFSQFDGDGDGEVDNVFVFVAGHDEAEGASTDHIWSHQWYFDEAGIRLNLDGTKINSYAISTELTYDFDYGTHKEIFTGIGTFCHEYSHALGLWDLYDTDGSDSGGLFEFGNDNSRGAVWGYTSLMDHGNYNDNGNTPPNYNAMELWSLGLGKAEPLEIGQQTLAPLSSQKRYFIAETDVKDEYYFFECRAAEGWDSFVGGSGMLIYHYDASNNDAGYSTSARMNLTARERWMNNEANCNPDHPCFDLIEAIPIAKDVYSVFWPNGTHTSFNASTSPSFSFWSGKGAETGLSGISRDGTFIRFTVTGSLSIEKVEEFQDAAIVLWTMLDSSDSGSCIAIAPEGGSSKEVTVKPYSPGSYSYTFEGLEPNTTYKVTVFKPGERNKGVSASFTTKKYYKDGYPFIYLNSAERNSNGSFKKNGKMPLRVFNAPDAAKVTWYYGNNVLSTDGSGYYTVLGSGTLQAVVDYKDGTRDIISKNITVQ